MAHGGKRPNAGRKAGAVSQRTREVAEALVADGGLTPLEFLTNVYRDVSEEMSRRVDAAKAAAQYVHPKLASVENKNETNLTLTGAGPMKLECKRES